MATETQMEFPEKLQDLKLECLYIGLVLKNPKAISMYYFLHDDCLFSEYELLNVYKVILFREGEAFAPEIAKKDFTFPRETESTYQLQDNAKKIAEQSGADIEETYIKLKKLFMLRKYYMQAPTREIQAKIIEIKDYELYEDMSLEEVDSAVEQINVTNRLSQVVLNSEVTDFLVEGNNTLTDGIEMPFPIMNKEFKGLRRGETMSFAMPSNAGKSRFTVNLAAYTAFVQKKKVLIISNEMSEEKMKLCLITTIINNPEIRKLHKQDVIKTEGELLEFKFRPDNPKDVEVDEDGYVVKGEKETNKKFAKRLSEISEEYRKTIAVTDWVNSQKDNSIHFVHITDHTNEELRKIILNYYYKEGIQYVFYDTLKTDTANIGNGEEIKKTATILSNIAQEFDIFIGSTLQLQESSTLPVNLTINDLATSRTVKEVLDTLSLIKQINKETLSNYEYSPEEYADKYNEIEKFKDSDVRHYACVVDKNRAGAKPTLLFRLNLAYNSWEELGYLRLKQK